MPDNDTTTTADQDEAIDTRVQALEHLEAARKHALELCGRRDYKNAIGDFLGALDANETLAAISPKGHGVHLIASNMANQSNVEKLINSVRLPEVES